MSDRPGVNWEASFDVRVNHRPRHSVSLHRNTIRRIHSAARSFGDFLWGAFTPIREAM